MSPRTTAAVVGFAVAVGACDERSVSRTTANSPAAVSAGEPAGTASAPPGSAVASASVGYPKPGFSPVRLEDEVPICVFSSYEDWQKVKFKDDVKPQNLRAGSRVVIGAFGPWCVNEACDDRPSLQCWMEREDEMLTVHTRYFGDHKDGAECTENCRSITAASASVLLEAGRYTVRYGNETFELRIPSVRQSPCFDSKK